MITLPVGMNILLIHGIIKEVSFETFVRNILPFFILMLFTVALLTFVPDLILFLLAHMLGR